MFEDNYVDSIINPDEAIKKEEIKRPTKVKTLDLKLGLIYPELPTKYYALNPLPRPKKAGPASLLAWLLYSNKMYLNKRWFEDHSDFWARSSLIKLMPITRFFYLMALVRPTIQRSWLKVAWTVLRFLFVILTIIGVVGSLALGSSKTWESHLVIGLMGTGLGFTFLNIFFWVLSFLLEKYFNRKWDPWKNKRFTICLKELVTEARRHFGCDVLKLNIHVLLFNDDEAVGPKKISKKTKKSKENLDKEIASWKTCLETMVSFINENIPNLIIETPVSYVSVKFAES